MPLYLDHHELGGPVTFAEVAAAHQADLREQAGHDVRYLRFWVDEARGRVFCLVEAPNVHAAQAVHLEAHGLVATEVFEVLEGA